MEQSVTQKSFEQSGNSAFASMVPEGQHPWTSLHAPNHFSQSLDRAGDLGILENDIKNLNLEEGWTTMISKRTMNTTKKLRKQTSRSSCDTMSQNKPLQKKDSKFLSSDLIDSPLFRPKAIATPTTSSCFEQSIFAGSRKSYSQAVSHDANIENIPSSSSFKLNARATQSSFDYKDESSTDPSHSGIRQKLSLVEHSLSVCLESLVLISEKIAPCKELDQLASTVSSLSGKLTRSTLGDSSSTDTAWCTARFASELEIPTQSKVPYKRPPGIEHTSFVFPVSRKSLSSPKRLLRIRSSSWNAPSVTKKASDEPRLFSPPITKQLLLQKQEKAQELRETILNMKAEKLKTKNDKIAAVKLSHQEQAKALKENLDEKQSKAEKLRQEYLKHIKLKAKEETTKRDEVQQNALTSMVAVRNDVQQRLKETEARRKEIQSERARKQTEVANLQEAASIRRQQQERLRLQKLEKEEFKRKVAEFKKEEAEKHRQAEKIARYEEKRKRMALKQVQEEQKRREWQEKVLEKLEQSSKRKQEQVLSVKEKAAIANESARKVAQRATEVKCQEVDPVREEVPFLCLSPIKECNWQSKKRRIKKLRIRLEQVGKDMIIDVTNQSSGLNEQQRSKIGRIMRAISSFNHRAANDELVLAIGEITKFSDKSPKFISQLVKCQIVQFLVENVCQVYDGNRSSMPIMSLRTCLALLSELVEFSVVRDHLLIWNGSTLILSLIQFSSSVASAFDINTDEDVLCLFSELMKILKVAFANPTSTSYPLLDGLKSISIHYNLLSRLHDLFLKITGPLNPLSKTSEFILHATEFLQVFTKSVDIEHLNGQDRPNQHHRDLLVETFQTTNSGGLITMLDTILLYKGGSYAEQVTQKLDDRIIQITQNAVSTLLNIAQIDLKRFQKNLGTEVNMTEFLHFTQFWISYSMKWANAATESQCEQVSNVDLLFFDLILLLGYACNGNQSNSELARLGSQRPLIITHLVKLPFQFFLDPLKKAVLLPTLIILCWEDQINRSIIESDLSLRTLGSYIQEQEDLPNLDIPTKYQLANRFPKNLWYSAKNAFLCS